MTTSTPAFTDRLRCAARWTAAQPQVWRNNPGYWAEQARTRYNLTQDETRLLLHNMELQAKG